MIAAIARPLIAVSALGWVAGLMVSLLALAGVEMPQWAAGTIFVGVFPVWLCAVLLMNRLSANVPNNELWKAAFRGCPRWLRHAIWASWGYTFLMFVLGATGRFEDTAAGFVGVLYASALGIFVTTAGTGPEPTECANGHPIGPFDKFCRECGAAIQRTKNVNLVD
jgi:hypothetical protein